MASAKAVIQKAVEEDIQKIRTKTLLLDKAIEENIEVDKDKKVSDIRKELIEKLVAKRLAEAATEAAAEAAAAEEASSNSSSNSSSSSSSNSSSSSSEAAAADAAAALNANAGSSTPASFVLAELSTRKKKTQSPPVRRGRKTPPPPSPELPAFFKNLAKPKSPPPPAAEFPAFATNSAQRRRLTQLELSYISMLNTVLDKLIDAGVVPAENVGRIEVTRKATLAAVEDGSFSLLVRSRKELESILKKYDPVFHALYLQEAAAKFGLVPGIRKPAKKAKMTRKGVTLRARNIRNTRPNLLPMANALLGALKRGPKGAAKAKGARSRSTSPVRRMAVARSATRRANLMRARRLAATRSVTRKANLIEEARLALLRKLARSKTQKALKRGAMNNA